MFIQPTKSLFVSYSAAYSAFLSASLQPLRAPVHIVAASQPFNKNSAIAEQLIQAVFIITRQTIRVNATERTLVIKHDIGAIFGSFMLLLKKVAFSLRLLYNKCSMCCALQC